MVTTRHRKVEHMGKPINNLDLRPTSCDAKMPRGHCHMSLGNLWPMFVAHGCGLHDQLVNDLLALVRLRIKDGWPGGLASGNLKTSNDDRMTLDMTMLIPHDTTYNIHIYIYATIDSHIYVYIYYIYICTLNYHILVYTYIHTYLHTYVHTYITLHYITYIWSAMNRDQKQSLQDLPRCLGWTSLHSTPGGGQADRKWRSFFFENSRFLWLVNVWHTYIYNIRYILLTYV